MEKVPVTGQGVGGHIHLVMEGVCDHNCLKKGSPVREGKSKGWGSSDNHSPYPKHEQKGHEAQSELGMPGSHSENVEQTREYGKRSTALSTEP